MNAVLRSARGERGFWRWLLILAVVYLALQAIFVLASLLSAAVPNGPIIQALSDGLGQHLWSDVDYPADGIGHVTERFPFAGVGDAYTQCIALTMNVPVGSGGWWDAAFAGRHLGACSTAVPAVQQLAAGGVGVDALTYNRYWNGYSALTRPLLALGGVGAVRVVVAALLLTALVAAVLALAKYVSPLAPLVLVPLFVSTNLVTQTADAFPHVLAFAVILFGMALGARLGREPLPLVLIGAVVAASAFNFVDYLLNPPAGWALFVFAVVAARWSAGLGTRALWAGAGAASLGWIAGYGVTWMTRWAIAVASFGQSAWNEIVGVVTNRLQGQLDGLVFPGPLQPTMRNTLFWLGTIPTSRAVAVLALAAVVVGIAVIVIRRRWRSLLVLAALAAPAALVVVWFELLNNHSQIHLFFVYRAVPVAVGVAATAALLAAFGRRKGVVA